MYRRREEFSRMSGVFVLGFGCTGSELLWLRLSQNAMHLLCVLPVGIATALEGVFY